MEGFDEFKNILVGVDESEGAQKAFQYAVKQASKTGAALLIASILEIEELNVYEALDPEYLSQKQSQLLLNMKKYKQYAENSGVKNIQLYSGEATRCNRRSGRRRRSRHRRGSSHGQSQRDAAQLACKVNQRKLVHLCHWIDLHGLRSQLAKRHARKRPRGQTRDRPMLHGSSLATNSTALSQHVPSLATPGNEGRGNPRQPMRTRRDHQARLRVAAKSRLRSATAGRVVDLGTFDRRGAAG